jgi:hypothetical protein
MTFILSKPFRDGHLPLAGTPLSLLFIYRNGVPAPLYTFAEFHRLIQNKARSGGLKKILFLLGAQSEL